MLRGSRPPARARVHRTRGSPRVPCGIRRAVPAAAAVAVLCAAAPAGSAAPPPERFDVPAPSRHGGATVARIVRATPALPRLYSRRPRRAVGPHTAWTGQPQVLLVLDAAVHDRREWVKVRLAERPSGSAAWIRRDHVVLARTGYWVRVRIRSRRVTVFRHGVRVRSFRAVVGGPASPTPLGLAAVYERNRQPDPAAFIGPWALALTSLSDVIQEFDGGPGRIAIHGRGGASLLDPLGSARSLGCVRVDNAAVAWLAARLPAGTPVRVTPT